MSRACYDETASVEFTAYGHTRLVNDFTFLTVKIRSSPREFCVSTKDADAAAAAAALTITAAL